MIQSLILATLNQTEPNQGENKPTVGTLSLDEALSIDFHYEVSTRLREYFTIGLRGKA